MELDPLGTGYVRNNYQQELSSFPIEMLQLIIEYFTDLYFPPNIVIRILSTEIPSTLNQKNSLNAIKKRVKEQCKVLLQSNKNDDGNNNNSNDTNKAQDILLIEYLGHKNRNYPLLIHLNDCIVRYYMNEWILNNKPNDIILSPSDFFDTHCKNKQFLEYITDKKSKYTLNFIKTAIASYQRRILPPFRFNEPIFRLNYDPLILCNYLFEIARCVRYIANTNIIPIQLEFVVINDKIKDMRPKKEECPGVDILLNESDDSDNDDFAEYDINDDLIQNKSMESSGIFGNIQKILKTTSKIKYFMYCDPLKQISRLKTNINKLIDGKRYRRIISVIDQRCNTEKLYVFINKTNKENYKFNANESELVHAALHNNTIRSICPNPESKEKRDFGALDSYKGQLFVMSFHIMFKTEIRCYVFYHGQCFRFFGEDLINILPSFFINPLETKKIMVNKYNNDQEWKQQFNDFCNTFNDKKFNMFYHGLIGKQPRIHIITKT